MDQIHVLRRYLATYLDMMAQRSLFLGDTNTTVRRVTEAGSALALERRPSDLSRDASDEPTSSLRVIAPIAAARGEPG